LLLFGRGGTNFRRSAEPKKKETFFFAAPDFSVFSLERKGRVWDSVGVAASFPYFHQVE
jgi:hypothetical protein